MKISNITCLCILFVSLCFKYPEVPAVAQVVSRPKVDATTNSSREETIEAIKGKWIYRSFRSDPAPFDPGQPLGDLLFGQGELQLEVDQADVLSGTLGGPGWQLNLEGSVRHGDPPSILFRGKGNIGGEEWIYDYLGYVVPTWPNGKEQRRAVVGTIVRTIDHGAAEAGYVAQWIAVKQERSQEATIGMVHGGSGPDADVSNYRKTIEQILLRNEAAKKNNERSLLNESMMKGLLDSPRDDSVTRPGEIELVVDYETVQIGQDQVNLRTYNGKLIGPEIRAKAGETIFITLRNKLPVEPSLGHGQNTHHEWNTTNLHFHGLHVAPQGPAGEPDEESDNVFVTLEPTSDPGGSVQKYAVRIPSNHVAGTFWYHAHKHGATAGQVASGMCGALIITRDDSTHNLDDIDEVEKAGEDIMVLQQIPYLKPAGAAVGFVERSSDGSLNNDWAAQMLSPASWHGQPGVSAGLRRYITVNGQLVPTIMLRPGEVRRLRLIHSGQREKISLAIERAPGDGGTGPGTLSFHEIAADGLPLGEIREQSVLDLYPGYRSDALINPDSQTSGEFYLVDRMAREGTGADGSPYPLKLVAKIVVSGSPHPMDLPTDQQLKPHRLKDIDPDDVQGTQYAYYGIVTNPLGFFISQEQLSPGEIPTGKEFSHTNIRLLELDKKERWVVGTRNRSGIQQFHPFHIHTNPFLIEKVLDPKNQDVTRREVGGPTWRDTLVMKQDYTYYLLTQYEDFTGEFVNHCHILDHEDNGMMEIVKVEAPSSPSSTFTPLAGGEALRIENQVSRNIPAPDGRPGVLFFVKGASCPHCMSQLTEMAIALAGENLDISVISAMDEDDLKQFPNVPFKLIADPDHRLFKKFGAYANGEVLHATIVRDGMGNRVLSEVGSEPFEDIEAIMAATERSPQVVIAVRQTDEVDDDYITWAPTPCTIRVLNGDLNSPELRVTLTNDDDSAISSGGNVAFARSLKAGHTATLPTLTLNLPQDGTPVPFQLAGTAESTLSTDSLTRKGRDAGIEVHRDSTDGNVILTQHVMVRVRKNIARLKPLELEKVLEAFSDLRDMSDENSDRFELLVRLHKLAAMERRRGFDQAHISSGFLPWHRAFLLQLERELQEDHPYVALPYWLMDQSPVHFTADSFGTNIHPRIGPQGTVYFSTTNPLYGWRIRFDGLGSLVRRAVNHTQVSQNANYNSQADLQGAAGSRYRFFRSALESDPHNPGHNNTGEWMAQCVSSPADPLFWIFHCHHDHLWARWQWINNRFENSSGLPEHYYPDGRFHAGLSDNMKLRFPLGHHREDKMWPWDETSLQQIPGEQYSTRPAINPFGKFRKSKVAFLWPEDPASPTCGEMLDYLGVGGSPLPHGVAYDDTPFGFSTQENLLASNDSPASVAESTRRNTLLLDVFADSGADEQNRLQAMTDFRAMPNEEATSKILGVLNAKGTSVRIRQKALRQLVEVAPSDAADAAQSLLSKPDTEFELLIAAVDSLTRMMHFSDIDKPRRMQIHQRLVRIAKVEERSDLRAAALVSLTAMRDPGISEIVGELLRNPGKSPVELSELIFMARNYKEHTELLRQHLKSPQLSTRVAAINALIGDQESIDSRRSLISDQQQPDTVRHAAMRSVMHDDQKAIEPFLEVMSDRSEAVEIRAEAAAALRVTIRTYRKTIPRQMLIQIRRVALDLRQTGDEQFSQTLSLLLRTLERSIDEN